MKTLRFILLLLSNILCIPLGVILVSGIVWYTLPELSATVIGTWLLSWMSPTAIFWTTIGSAILFTILSIVQRLFAKYLPVKLKNFFIHASSWLMGIVGIGLVIATFILNQSITNDVIIANVRKIGIGICLLLLIVFHLLTDKINRLVNRRLQAYETAKEVGAVGRSSIIFTNILKVFEMLFPEVLVLLIICFCTSWNVASYFIVILVACVFPLLGNIECDINIRRKAKADKKAEQNKIAELTAKKMKEENR